ncbi:PQQ-dependent sugar dehydrogenase [Schumannella luteola]|uniref:Glucose/arabinose dehydrogenase n=1 Tax=Schumannella luteola TaxID=472059 RepID=A0A852YSL2_9MICO|nr:PQQ-dependent sugar dehydrogenase [Schumannella luteola]NYH00690.1 glucose/arabinose dehydrogenase [Schumannella luteola]TPX02467.1 PQQ-dependent sugar dehydrogenase [Schumannella luteola]
MARRIQAALAAAALAGLALSGCGPTTTAPATPTPTPPSTAAPAGYTAPTGEPTVLATGLESPWSIVRLSTGETLISERDSGRIVQVGQDGDLDSIGTVPGVVHQGEGGLLGLAEHSDGSMRWLYAYLTTQNDNRIVRMPLGDELGLGTPQIVLKGLAKAANHDGGRIAFGPDGMLYATVGDAGEPARAQDRSSLNGKILRMTPTGGVPEDNPFDGSLVYSLGHRNPQGLAWDASGQLYAAEFGQDTWDEFNRIQPGKNYGWPIVEGQGDKKGYVDPLLQWKTDDASPSGLAYVGGTFYLAALKGQRLWSILPGDLGRGWTQATSAEGTPWFEGAYGRIRDAVPGPDGTLWIITNNTDGRGSAKSGDDKLLQVSLTAQGAG